ncbi:hypothetical protein [Glutamicibacter sp. NPDC087344]|uniref:hypothetical protein n=1 Tax=Glutamicibacter sp. NPDC087344 TaxID=3363994 RepID=UPI00382DD28D
MGLFSRKRHPDSPAIEDWKRQIEDTAPLQVEQVHFTAKVLGVGLKGKKLIPAVELTFEETAGYFRADELEALTHGHVGIIDSLPGSPVELFLATGKHVDAASAAGEALADAPKDHIAILLPTAKEMRCLALFSTTDQLRIAHWLTLFPRR